MVYASLFFEWSEWVAFREDVKGLFSVQLFGMHARKLSLCDRNSRNPICVSESWSMVRCLSWGRFRRICDRFLSSLFRWNKESSRILLSFIEISWGVLSGCDNSSRMVARTARSACSKIAMVGENNTISVRQWSALQVHFFKRTLIMTRIQENGRRVLLNHFLE